MAILADERTKVIIQGITGRVGSAQAKLMLDYGTKIVAGVTPGRGGQEVNGIPVYDSVEEALKEHEADASVVFVPAPVAKDSVFEAIQSGLRLIVVVTERIPIHDAMEMKALADAKGAILVGPNTPGIITPGRTKLGIMPGNLYKRGNIGIVARSATLAYEIAANLTEAGMGQSTCLGIGGDRVTGMTFVDALKLFEEDGETKGVVLVGEIGRRVEEEAADYIREGFDKPVLAFIAGRGAVPGKRMGHAGAIIEGGRGTAESKIDALRRAGATVINRPSEVVEAARGLFR
ncbi:MAG: succinate--CoA ligase subunit alpha [Candidatus Bathyarchaeia archaeon]